MRGKLLVMLFASAVLCHGTVKPQKVKVQFYKSEIADYLFYLLNRSVGDYSQLTSVVPLGDITPMDRLTFAPEDAISSNVASCGKLYSMVASYDDHERLSLLLRQGEPHFAAFRNFWRSNYRPERT